MDWIDRINERFLSTLRMPKAGTTTGVALLRLSPTLIQQLVRLELTSYDEYVGETLVLFGCLADGNLVAINESDAEWIEVCEALDQSGRLPLLINTAKLQYLANKDRESLCILGNPDVNH